MTEAACLRGFGNSGTSLGTIRLSPRWGVAASSHPGMLKTIFLCTDAHLGDSDPETASSKRYRTYLKGTCGSPSMHRTLTKPKARKSKASVSRTQSRGSIARSFPPVKLIRPQRRRDILRAAAELFSIHGYNSVSLRDIARRAKVPATLCSYYFGPKSELFASVFLHNPDGIEGRRTALKSFGNEGTLEDLIRLWIEPVVDMRSNPEQAPSQF